MWTHNSAAAQQALTQSGGAVSQRQVNTVALARCCSTARLCPVLRTSVRRGVSVVRCEAVRVSSVARCLLLVLMCGVRGVPTWVVHTRGNSGLSGSVLAPFLLECTRVHSRI